MPVITIIYLILLAGAVLILTGVLSSLAARRFGMPLLLVFLVIGMLAGEDGPLGLHFDDVALTYLVGSAALAVILFDGGLRTRLSTFRGVLAPSLLMSTMGVAITMLTTGIAAQWLLDLSWLQGQLLGAVVAATDAAAVFFLIRASGLQLRHRVGATLEIESGTNDPAAVFLTFLLISLIREPGHMPGSELLLDIAWETALGAAGGLLGGLAVTWLLNRVELAAGLHALFVVSAAIAIFATVSLMQGSGYLAVYLAGLVVGNRPVRAYASIVAFHDTATWLAQIVMFLTLGLLATPSRLLDTALPALGVALFLMLVARPLAAWVCLAPFGFDRREIGLVGWVGLRGAVSIFLATVPMLSGMPKAAVYFDVAFCVVLVSLLVQGSTITLAARRLGQALPRPDHPVQRIELDLPGQLNRELVGYPVRPGSAVLTRDRLPRWAPLVLVVRDDRIIEPRAAGALQVGDYAYMLAPTERVRRLDGLFAEGGEAPARGLAVMGEFTLDGNARLGDLALLYGVDLAGTDPASSVADLFADRFDTEPVLGDRLPFGNAELVVREIDEERVTRAGLLLEETVVGAVLGSAILGPGRFARLVRKLRRIG